MTPGALGTGAVLAAGLMAFKQVRDGLSLLQKSPSPTIWCPTCLQPGQRRAQSKDDAVACPCTGVCGAARCIAPLLTGRLRQGGTVALMLASSGWYALQRPPKAAEER